MLKNFFQNHRKLITGLILCFFVFLVVAPVPTNAFKCDVDIFGIGKTVCNVVTYAILSPMMLCSLILGIAGFLLNTVIDTTIIGIKSLLDGISGINIAWSVIRDLVNISFIFILLYTAIMTIVGEGGQQIKKAITGVVLAAILINFSLFFTKVVIDTSNLVTITFHEAIVTNCGEDATVRATLSDCIMQPLGLGTLYQPTDETLEGLNGNISKALTISIGGSIFILIAAFIFLAISIMLIVRFVTIIFLLIFSPIGIVGFFLPHFAGQSKKWWSEVSDQVLFPPAFMILMWVVLTILRTADFVGLGSTAQLSDMFDGAATAVSGAAGSTTAPGFIGLIFNFIIIIALLIGTLTISKGFSKKGGEMGSKFAGAVLGGGLGFVGRRTVGRIANNAANSEKLKEAASQSGFRGASARLALRSAQSTTKSSFDLRGANSSISKQLGAGSATGKGGFGVFAKDKIEKEKKFAETLKASDLEKDRIESNLKKAQKLVDDKVSGAETEVKTAKDAVATKRASAVTQAESLITKSQLQIDAENNLAQWKLGANAPGLDPIKKKEINDNIAKYTAEIDLHKRNRESAVETRAEQILNTTAVTEKAALAAAETRLKDAKEGTSTERADLVKAQIESDKIKGINPQEKETRAKEAQTILEENLRNERKKIDDDLASNVITTAQADTRRADIDRLEKDGTKLKEAQAQLYRTKGLAIHDKDEENSSLDTKRQVSYANTLTSRTIAGIPITPNKVGFVGKISRENLGAALAIRKATKEKSDADKFADLAKKMAKDTEKKEGDTKPATPPASDGAPVGGTP